MSTLTSLKAQPWIGDSTAFRRLVTISNPGDTNLIDYQVKITLNNSTFNFSDAKNDGSDIRLTASDGTTFIPFWIEEWIYGTQATIWVKVPSIPISGTNVYLYYGNSTATKAGNGSSTFEFFDDFESWAGDTSSSWGDKAPLPIPIADLSSAVYDGKLYSFGGYGNGPTNSLDKNYVYDPIANMWTEKTHMPTARWGMAAVEFNGLIYVFGGSSGGGLGDVKKNEVYDPLGDSWITKADIPGVLGRQGVMGVRFGDKIHLFYESYHYEYDPVTDLYTQKADVPKPRFWCTSAVVGSKIYLIGGIHGEVPHNDNQEYDPATDSWATKAPLPTLRWGTTRDNPVINGKIYVTHGIDGNSFHTENFVYDPAADTWEQKGPASHPRDGVGCGVINNKFYVVGGRADFVGPYGLVYNEVYDPSIDTWALPGPSLWSTSPTKYVFADTSAKFQGNYGLFVQQPINEDTNTLRYAQTIQGFGNIYALDFNWKITDANGIGDQPKPQGLVTLTETDYIHNTSGSLFFYNSDGTPMVNWYTGTNFNPLQSSTWNSWHNVTIIRNGPDSKVIFDGNLYQSPIITSPLLDGTGRIMFGVYWATKQYLDNVRVRKWAGVNPFITIGVAEANPLPVELFSFTSNINGKNISLIWETKTEINSNKFIIEREINSTNWESIGSINASGTINSPKKYSYTDKNLKSGIYRYRLKMVDNDGSFEYSKIIEAKVSIPRNFELGQNYPNPFNPSTKINYNLPLDSKVTFEIYNVMGEKIGQLVNQEQSAGYYTIEFNSSSFNKNISSGVYLYKVTAVDKSTGNNFISIKKMILLK